MSEYLQVNSVTFPSADGKAELRGLWHLPAQRATNGAVLVLHGSSYTKEAELNLWICEGAARLGLTALRFDFRYIQAEQSATKDLTLELDDLVGAYNFLQSFGKEIKPQRFYVVGKSLGAIVAMKAVAEGPLSDAIKGVVALGLPLHDPTKKTWFDYSALSKLTCPVLLVVGERDPFGDPLELQPLLQTLTVAKELAIISGGGHSYEPLISPDEPALTASASEIQQQLNQRQVVAITIEWLERQDKIRKELRK